MKIKNITIKKIIILTFLLFLVSSNCLAQEVTNLPSKVRTPEDLVKWYANEFEYRMEIWDEWQDPEQTIAARKGDCEDFAYLTHAVLKDLGFDNKICFLKFKGIKTKHAVCIFKAKDGNYSIISNKALYRTRQQDMYKAVKRFYPDCISVEIVKTK